MGLDDLLAALAREARLEARAVLKQAHADRQEVLEASKERIAALQRRRLESQQSAFDDEARERIAAVRRETRAALLAAQEDLVERVVAGVEKKIDAPAALEHLKSTLPRRVPLLLRYGEGREMVLRCTPGLAETIRDLPGLPADLEVREDAEVAGGVRLESADGDLVIDDTLPDRLQRRRRALRMRILREVGEAGD